MHHAASQEKQQHATEPSRESIDRDVDECLDPVAQLSGKRHVKQFHAGPVQGVARRGFCEANDATGQHARREDRRNR